MTLNDLELTKCAMDVHNNEAVISKLTRDNEREELRRVYKDILYAAFKALDRLEKL